MELLLAFVADFWWIAPASLGAGGVGYAVITKNSRRARRIELDAARHEELVAYRDSLTAKAHVRAAVAQVQTAQAHRGRTVAGVPTVADAKRALQHARQAQKNAMLLLRASRSRVKAQQAALSASSRSDALPLERLMHAHDEVTARWLAYETDAALVLMYPQMSDARHPATLAFLRAQSDAHQLRPATVSSTMRPEEYVAYRRAVETLTTAFADAEASARQTAAVEARRTATTRRPVVPTPPKRSGLSAAQGQPTRAEDPPAARGVWPIPSRTSRPPERLDS